VPAQPESPSDEGFMRLALQEARKAPHHDDVPIGAVAVRAEEVIASGHNERELTGDPTAHAEILVLRRAAAAIDHWRLADVTVYCTIEPCPRCAGAMVAARVRRVVYGAPDEVAGAAYSIYNIVQDPRLLHRCELAAGILRDECTELVQEFFRQRREPPPVL
jgi:tRNA(adenine34) deaminase